MQKIVVLTGAGISADSGLKTFRDSDGLWEGHNVEEVATPQAFVRNPQLVLDFYNARRRQLKEVVPNAAHLAIAKLQEYFDVHVVTQNVDNLHERAGSRQIVHLHGELTKLRSTVNEGYVVDWTEDQSLADVDDCGHRLRPHIVWFGESVPLIRRAVELVSEADTVIIVGTSMKVYPAAGLLEYAPDAAKCYLVDPKPPEGVGGVEVVATKAKDGVPGLVERLIQSQHEAG